MKNPNERQINNLRDKESKAIVIRIITKLGERINEHKSNILSFFWRVIVLQCCVGFCHTNVLRKNLKIYIKKKKTVRAEGYNN